jgi:hypothetical protein
VETAKSLTKFSCKKSFWCNCFSSKKKNVQFSYLFMITWFMVCKRSCVKALGALLSALDARTLPLF